MKTIIDLLNKVQNGESIRLTASIHLKKSGLIVNNYGTLSLTAKGKSVIDLLG